MTTAPVQTQTYATTVAMTVTTPSWIEVKTTSPPLRQATIAGGGPLLASGRLQRTGSMVTSRSTGRGTAQGKMSTTTGTTGSGSTSSGMASGSGGMQSGGSMPSGSMSGQGTGGGSTGRGSTPVGSLTGGNLPAGPPGGPPAGSGGSGGNPGGQPNLGGQAVQAATQGGPVPPINGAMKSPCSICHHSSQ